MPKFKLIVDCGFVGCQHEGEAEFDQEDWEMMTPEEREKALEEEAVSFMHDRVDVSWEEVTD